MALAGTSGHFHVPTVGSVSTSTTPAFISYAPGDEAGGALMLVALLGAHAAEHSTWSENRAILWRSAYPVNMGEEVLFSMKERHYTREMMGLFSLCAFMGISTMQQ